MKILHFISNRWNSAITEYALSVVNSLNRFQVKNVFCSTIGSPAEKRALGYGFDLDSLQTYRLKNLMEFRGKIQKNQPNIIICYGGVESTLTHFLYKMKFFKNDVKLVRFRGQDIDEETVGWGLWRYRAGNKLNDLVITPSHILAAKHKKLCPEIPVKTVILGCDPNKFKISKPCSKPSRPQILIVGRFDPVKGHFRALRIFRHLLIDWKNEWGLPPQLHILGQPANLSEQDIHQAIIDNSLKIGVDVLLTTKRIPDVESLMAKAAVGFISSVDSEIICRVAQEFLMCGAPVFVSGVGSLNEVLLENSFGLTYAMDRDQQASEKLSHLVRQSVNENYDQRILRSVNANHHFSWESMGKELFRILTELNR